MLCESIGTRAECENIPNERQESKLGDGADGIDGVQVDGEVLQALFTLSFKLEKMKTWKIKKLITLT